jgi:hypothetical protein
VLERRLAALAPASPMAHERSRAHELLRRAPNAPPRYVKRSSLRMDDG